MNTARLLVLLDDEELSNEFSFVIARAKECINSAKDLLVVVSDNIFPAKHFLDIYTTRMRFMKKNKSIKPIGFEETIRALQDWDGGIRVGYISSEGGSIALLFSGDLAKVVALFKMHKHTSVLGKTK